MKKAYTFKPRKKEAPQILEFLKLQSNFNDAIRYLIEKDISENGVRDIVKYIPAVRDFNNLNELVVDSIEKNSNNENVIEDNLDIPDCYS